MDIQVERERERNGPIEDKACEKCDKVHKGYIPYSFFSLTFYFSRLNVGPK